MATETKRNKSEFLQATIQHIDITKHNVVPGRRGDEPHGVSRRAIWPAHRTSTTACSRTRNAA